MKRLLLVAGVALLLAACDYEQEPVGNVAGSNELETNAADECPRADGQPCR